MVQALLQHTVSRHFTHHMYISGICVPHNLYRSIATSIILYLFHNKNTQLEICDTNCLISSISPPISSSL